MLKEHTDLEVLPPAMAGMSGAAELVASGFTLSRLENDVQMSISVQRPRDEEKILAGAMRELTLYPSLAEEAIYSKPVGKDDVTGKMKYASGLSIRTAESLANRWGNNAYGCELAGETEDYAILTAVYLDYETNTRTVLQKRVSKSYKSRQRGIQKYSPDRFDIILAANQSKLLREAILRRLPAGLKREYELKAKEILSAKPIGERQEKVILSFSGIGVKKEQLEKLIGKTMAQFNHEDMDNLIGYYNALKDGETTIDALIEKQSATPTYDLDEKTLIELEDYFNILKTPPADRQMKLAKCKGSPAEVETLKKELMDSIKTMPPTGEALKSTESGPPPVEELFGGKKAGKK